MKDLVFMAEGTGNVGSEFTAWAAIQARVNLALHCPWTHVQHLQVRVS